MPDSVSGGHALILAPSGRDAEIAAGLLGEIGVLSRAVTGLHALAGALSETVFFVVATEEELRTADLRDLQAWTEDQPSWSDLAFIILTRHGGGPDRNPAAARLSEILGNVTFVERPFHPTTFLSVARSALRGRRRQFENRRAQADLRESGERLETALIAGRLGSWELDVARRELSASASCKAIFGRGPDEPFTYEDLLASIDPQDLDRMQTAVAHTIETGTDYAIEYRTIWPDGSRHWVEIRARLVRHGDRVRMVGVSLDITARKEAESRLLGENEALEVRVAERTRELESAHEVALEQVAQREAAESKLFQSQKMEMIGQLTGGIAHDFNNLLMVVLSNLDLLKRQLPSSPRTDRLFDGALQAAQRGATLTQRLLAFARRQDLDTRVADLGELVRNMKPLIERTIGSAIELAFTLPDRPMLARIDPNQIDLALLNLIVNARDAMPDGGRLEIVLDLRPGDPAESRPPHIGLSVTDTGQGMDEATLRRATEPFFTTKGVGKGTGLGLSMIHGLVQQLEGELHISSTVGVGTRVELVFPQVDDERQVPSAPAIVASPAARPTAPERSKAKILMVDDDVLIAMSSVDMLEDLGYEVVDVNSGEAALRHLSGDEDFDLLITDFSMPRMNGMELALAARKMHPDLPIILATGYAELPAGEKLDLPRLGKPYLQEQLQAQIELALSGRQFRKAV